MTSSRAKTSIFPLTSNQPKLTDSLFLKKSGSRSSKKTTPSSSEKKTPTSSQRKRVSSSSKKDSDNSESDSVKEIPFNARSRRRKPVTRDLNFSYGTTSDDEEENSSHHSKKQKKSTPKPKNTSTSVISDDTLQSEKSQEMSHSNRASSFTEPRLDISKNSSIVAEKSSAISDKTQSKSSTSTNVPTSNANELPPEPRGRSRALKEFKETQNALVKKITLEISLKSFSKDFR